MQSFLDALETAVNDALESLGYVLGRIPTVVVALLVVLVFARLAQFVVNLLDRAGRISPRLDPSLKILIRQLISAGIIIFGIAVGFSLLGLNLTTIAATFGVAGLVVGFALKDMLENFVAGILILWRRPFDIADHIKVGDESGVVRDISFRTTTLRTLDGVEVLIPNAQVFNKALYNFTHFGSRRSTIVFKVSTDTDLARAHQRMLTIARATGGVLAEPAPEVLLLGGGSDAHELHLRYWTGVDPQIIAHAESAIRSAVSTMLMSGELRRDDITAAGDDGRSVSATASTPTGTSDAPSTSSQ